MECSFTQFRDLQKNKEFLKNLGLKDDNKDTRAKILSFWDSVDIPSCPGSGKTTILVAKLALVIENWKNDSKGICVLSHTNVAKDEIRRRLSSSQTNKLLNYPHFVGTIHEFFNKYLAIPWLKSNNIPIRLIDNELTYKKCIDSIWVIGKSNNIDDAFLRKFANQNHISYEKLTKLDWMLNNEGKFLLSNSQEPFEDFQRLLKKSLTKQGYHTHNDMVAHSKYLLFKCPDISRFIMSRFPIVFIDEAQDTNESQSELINRIFDPQKTIIQRFGDSDQQIFDFGEETTTDTFPDASRIINDLKLDETQRCSPSISAVAEIMSASGQHFSSVAVNGIKQPKPHIIVFDENSINSVILKFVELLQEEIELPKGSIIKVVGQIGKQNSENKNIPYSICDYESSFTKPSNYRIGKPKNLSDLITNCQKAFSEDSENKLAINLFFSGIARLLGDQIEVNYSTNYPFRSVRNQLDMEINNSNGKNGRGLLQELYNIYNDIISHKTEYNIIKTNLELVITKNGFNHYLKSFFDTENTDPSSKTNKINLDDIEIELNTIAGIKGETHLATLILETFYRGHNIEKSLLTVFGIIKTNSENIKRVKHLFVAMSRPTNFLCLAIPKNEYENLILKADIRKWFDTCFIINDI